MINTLIKEYRLIRELGRGGMATVYLAEHQLLHKKVAIKFLNEDLIRNESIRKRFLAEARSMAKMAHPSIIGVNDFIEEGGMVAFVMEYIEGETLKEYLERKGRLADDEIKSLFSQMLDAVGYVHEQNLVHRDIKPSNFMIDLQGKVKLMDFGIAKSLDPQSPEYTQTGTGVQMGTPMYMSPEQVKESKSVSAQSDIYSLGVVLWQIVTGKRPYEVQTLSDFELKSLIVNEPLPETGTHWDEDIQKATAKEPSGRFSNCDAWKNCVFEFDFNKKVKQKNKSPQKSSDKITKDELTQVVQKNNDSEITVHNDDDNPDKILRFKNETTKSSNGKVPGRRKNRNINKKRLNKIKLAWQKFEEEEIETARCPNCTFPVEKMEEELHTFGCFFGLIIIILGFVFFLNFIDRNEYFALACALISAGGLISLIISSGFKGVFYKRRTCPKCNKAYYETTNEWE